MVESSATGAASGRGRAGTRETGGPAAGPTGLLAPDEGDPAWVDAGPFRAHLRHLMAVGRLDATEVALVLGLSTPAVQHLLEGRAGRAQRRISPHTARCLLLVGADEVRGLRWCLTPADAARAALRRLLAEGWSVHDVATAVGAGLAELAALEGPARCSRLLAVRLVGLARALPTTLDDEDLVPLPSAA